MADIHHVITLGIGTPASLEHFTLVGLNAAGGATLPNVARAALESDLSAYTVTGPRYRVESRLAKYTVERG